MQYVCGIKSRGRAIARRGDHDPDEQMNGPAHGGPRGAAAFQGGDETEGAGDGGLRLVGKTSMSTIEKSPLINWGRGLRLVRYGIVFGAGKAITAVTQAAAVASCLLRRRYISGTVREQPCRWPRCRLDRSDDIAGVISKEIEQRTPSRSARVRQAEPARDVRLERPAETVFGPTCEQMQMTPHLP